MIYFRLIFLSCGLVAGMSMLDWRSEPPGPTEMPQPNVKLIGFLPESHLEVQGVWQSLRNSQMLGSPEVVAPGVTRYPRTQISEDVVSISPQEWQAVLGDCIELPDGVMRSLPGRDRLVLVLEPHTDEARFEPGSSEDSGTGQPTLRLIETAWPEAKTQAGFQRHEFPPKESYFLLTEAEPGVRSPVVRRQTGLGIALLEPDGRVLFGAHGNPEHGIDTTKEAWLLIGIDSAGRTLAWFEEP